MTIGNATNFFEASLKITLFDSDISMTLNPLAVGVSYPPIPFRLRVGDEGVTEYEFVNVTSRTNDTLQITRDAEGTGAFSYLAGSSVSQVFTAGHWTEMKNEIESASVLQSSLENVIYSLAGNEDGVIRNSEGTSLLVKESPVPDLNVVISEGFGFINETLYSNTSDITLGLLAPPATVDKGRYDIVYLDHTTKTVEVLTGTEQDLPPLIPTIGLQHINIARILVEYGDTTIVDIDITDIREFI